MKSFALGYGTLLHSNTQQPEVEPDQCADGEDEPDDVNAHQNLKALQGLAREDSNPRRFHPFQDFHHRPSVRTPTRKE